METVSAVVRYWGRVIRRAGKDVVKVMWHDLRKGAIVVAVLIPLAFVFFGFFTREVDAWEQVLDIAVWLAKGVGLTVAIIIVFFFVYLFRTPWVLESEATVAARESETRLSDAARESETRLANAIGRVEKTLVDESAARKADAAAHQKQQQIWKSIDARNETVHRDEKEKMETARRDEKIRLEAEIDRQRHANPKQNAIRCHVSEELSKFEAIARRLVRQENEAAVDYHRIDHYMQHYLQQYMPEYTKYVSKWPVVRSHGAAEQFDLTAVLASCRHRISCLREIIGWLG
jgi:flagellar biosynthesis GTPase FlhF